MVAMLDDRGDEPMPPTLRSRRRSLNVVLRHAAHDLGLARADSGSFDDLEHQARAAWGSAPVDSAREMRLAAWLDVLADARRVAA